MSTPPPLSRHRAASGAQRGQRARTPCEAAYPQWCLQRRRVLCSRRARASYTDAQPPSEKRGFRCCKRTTLPCSHLRRSWRCQLPGYG
eukprot:scaffold15929_cov54-Phaeocystis_antarctica.AAC.1